MKKLAIGLLDFGVRRPSMNSLLRVSDLLDYAGRADSLGFSRLWLSEHHIPLALQAWGSPTILLPLLAGMTSRIRIGVAGVLLSIHQPYHVAAEYKMLNNLFPNRIDLGLANGGVMPTVAELATGIAKLNMPDAFNANLAKLFFCLREEEEVLKLGTVLPPYKGSIPPTWALTTNMGRSLQRALDYKMNLSRSIFHKGADRGLHKEALLAFREDFFARHQEYPKTNLVIAGVVHQTTAKARAAAPTTEEGYDYNIVGTPAQFHETVLQYQHDYGFDEVIIHNVALRPKDRVLALELWSDMFGLKASARLPVTNTVA
jgi:alkanesulfonate monooxygenase SsuD/methylene tetrahydromethanopterin reductase-like flavin-dependent oxidoreductase (luciferase family)